MALGRQAHIELELKRREAVYRDVLSKQQTVSPKAGTTSEPLSLPQPLSPSHAPSSCPCS